MSTDISNCCDIIEVTLSLIPKYKQKPNFRIEVLEVAEMMTKYVEEESSMCLLYMFTSDLFGTIRIYHLDRYFEGLGGPIYII